MQRMIAIDNAWSTNSLYLDASYPIRSRYETKSMNNRSWAISSTKVSQNTNFSKFPSLATVFARWARDSPSRDILARDTSAKPLANRIYIHLLTDEVQRSLQSR